MYVCMYVCIHVSDFSHVSLFSPNFHRFHSFFMFFRHFWWFCTTCHRSLRRCSRHYQTGEALPEAAVEMLVQSSTLGKPKKREDGGSICGNSWVYTWEFMGFWPFFLRMFGKYLWKWRMMVYLCHFRMVNSFEFWKIMGLLWQMMMTMMTLDAGGFWEI